MPITAKADRGAQLINTYLLGKAGWVWLLLFYKRECQGTGAQHQSREVCELHVDFSRWCQI